MTLEETRLMLQLQARVCQQDIALAQARTEIALRELDSLNPRIQQVEKELAEQGKLPYPVEANNA